jgi:hypothetical protein
VLSIEKRKSDSMKNKIEYKIFPWGIRTKDFEKTLKNVEKFINRSEVIDVISIINSSFGIIVWYKAHKTLRIMQKKP